MSKEYSSGCHYDVTLYVVEDFRTVRDTDVGNI